MKTKFPYLKSNDDIETDEDLDMESCSDEDKDGKIVYIYLGRNTDKEKEKPRGILKSLPPRNSGKEAQESSLKNRSIGQTRAKTKTRSREKSTKSQQWPKIIVLILTYSVVIILFFLVHTVSFLLQATFFLSALYSVCATVTPFLAHTVCHGSEVLMTLLVETVYSVCEAIPRLIFRNVFRICEVILPLLVHNVCRVVLTILPKATHTLSTVAMSLLKLLDQCICGLWVIAVHALTRPLLWLISIQEPPHQMDRDDDDLSTSRFREVISGVCTAVEQPIHSVFSTCTVIVVILDETLCSVFQDSANLLDETVCSLLKEVIQLLDDNICNIWIVTVELIYKVAKEVIQTFFSIVNSMLRLIQTEVKPYCINVAADLREIYHDMISLAKKKVTPNIDGGSWLEIVRLIQQKNYSHCFDIVEKEIARKIYSTEAAESKPEQHLTSTPQGLMSGNLRCLQ